MIAAGVLCVDRIAPTVNITSPAAGNVSGTITISAAAADNDQVASVQFTYDGANLGSAMTVAPYQMTQDTHSWVNGAHTIGVKVLDREGNQVTSSVAITVKNNPIVTLTSPAAGNVSGTISLAANVTGYGTGITVQFQRDGGSIGPAMTVGPYQYSYDTHPAVNGAHTFGVVATDAQGNATTVTVNVTVKNVPVVSLSPANGAHTSGTTTLTANVTQYGTSCTVQFQIDGANLGGAQSGGSGTYQAAHDSHLLGVGWHSYNVIVTDAQGNSTTVSNGLYVENAVPAAGVVSLGDMYVHDPDGNYYSGRYSPEPYDGTGGDWYWGATGTKFNPVYLPGNPDPTHYQMQVGMHGERVEGGSDGNQVYIDFQVAGIVGWTTVWQNGPTWSFNSGPFWNVNGGEACYAKRWCSNPGWNTCFCQGIGFWYSFQIKAGYGS